MVKIASDVTQSKLEYAELLGKVKAIDKSQGMIEFNLDGTVITANPNFLDLVGYDLDEVVGHHHSMFVDSDYAKSAEYREFWAGLNRGEFEAKQYRRRAKGGRYVWIEASYNPIFDMNGKVYKVVKFATDITRQVNMLNELKQIIDVNFGEIDQAVELTGHRSHGAEEGAKVTLDNVQMVAAAAEELSSSVHEISQSMCKSRQASDDAFAKVDAANRATVRLTEAAQSMGGIIELIQRIARQINMLALNATIESARAGEAGKGFAVVANEVKNLAKQVADATTRISHEIDGVQSVAVDVASSLGSISHSIDVVREYVTSTAGAVEEQNQVTREMSANMQSASGAVNHISASIGEIVAAIGQVAGAVSRTKESAQVLAR